MQRLHCFRTSLVFILVILLVGGSCRIVLASSKICCGCCCFCSDSFPVSTGFGWCRRAEWLMWLRAKHRHGQKKRDRH